MMNRKIMAGILSIAMVVTSLSFDTTNVYASQDDILLENTAEDISTVDEALVKEESSATNDSLSGAEDTGLISEPVSDSEISETGIPTQKSNALVSVDKEETGTATVGDFKFSIDDKAGTATVIDWLNSDHNGKAVIPPTIPLPEGYISGIDGDSRVRRVTAIGSNAFASNKEDLVEVTIDQSISSISPSAFYGCTALTEVVLPQSLDLLGTSAFKGCTNLENVTLPNTLKSIGHSVFEGCTKLTSITIPEKMSLEAVDTNNGKAGPFTGASNLKTIQFANNIEEITHDLFSFSNIENISIPDTVTKIGGKAFYSCTGLKSVSFSESSKLNTIEESAFETCPALAGITLPKFTKSIGKKAFSIDPKKYDDPKLKNVSIPDSIKTIGESAFQGCINLEKVVFTEGDVGNEDGELGASCFAGCNNLTGIDIPRKIKIIGKEAFKDCYSMTTLTFPEGLLTIGDSSFLGCYSLNDLTMPNTVTSIGAFAFSGCSGVVTLTLSNKLESIGKGAFSSCVKIASVEIPKSLIKVNGLAQNSKKTEGVFNNCSSLKDVTFESGITAIPDYLFFGHDWLQRINIPTTVTSIGDGAFMYCDILSNAIIPGSVENIGNYAFADCKKINNPNGGDLIPEGVKSIGGYAFRGCLALEKIVIPKGVETVGEHAFSGCTLLAAVTLPNNIKTIITAKNQTGLGMYCFERCTKLTTVTLPANLTEIPEGLFYECTSLKTVNLSKDDLTAIGSKAFYNCDAFASLDNSKILDFSEFSKLKTIGESAFQQCDGIEGVKLSAATTTLGKLVFDNCHNLGEISLGTGLATIPEGAFSNILNLKKITIPSNVTAIGAKAFHSDQNLVEVHIPKTTVTLGDDIFSYNEKLYVYGVEDSEIHKYCTKNSIKFNTERVYVSKLEFLQNSIEINKGVKNYEVAYKAEPENYTEDIIFESTDEDVFTVASKSGKVYINAISGGNAKLTAKSTLSDNKIITAEMDVTVRVPVTAIRLDRSTANVQVGRFFTLKPTITPSDANDQRVTWSSDRESVAKVSSLGVVTGVSEGEAVISAVTVDGEKKATCKVTVTAATKRDLKPHEVEIDDFIYLIDDEHRTAAVSGWLNNNGDGTAVIPDKPITLPASYDTGLDSGESRERTIVAIGSKAFDESLLKSITIPANILTIENNAFNNCVFLESITLPERMTSIGDSAFYGCATLNHVDLPAKIDAIGSKVFDGCLELKEITIPKNMDLKTIGNPNNKTQGPFAGNLGLKNVLFESGIEVIPEKLFMGCTSLESIKIPDSVSTIGTIKQNGNTVYSSSYTFAYCSNLATVTISESSSLSKVLAGAFMADNKLDSIILPEQTILVDNKAFYNCSGLKNVSMPDSIGDIGESAFEGCTNLSTVGFRDGDSSKTDDGSIAKRAFYNCFSLSAISIPRRIREIGEKAFYIEAGKGVSSLEILTLPIGLESIGVDAFNGCSKLTRLEIPYTVESIGAQAFMGGSAITNLTIVSGSDKPSRLTTIGHAAFKNCSSIDKVKIPKSMGEKDSKVTGISYTVKGKDLDKDATLKNEHDKGVFAGCTKLKTIEFENGILGIPECMFFGTDSINSVEIPATVTSIGNGAFRACRFLTYITIPDSVNSIGDYAFANCHSLKKKDVTTEIIPVGNIKTICSYAFYDCTALTKVVLPAGIEALGEHAYDGCTTLTEFVVPDSVKGVFSTKDKKGLGAYCFADCSKLQKVQLPADMATVPEGLFKECVALTSVNLSKDYLTAIGKEAFYNCDAFVSFNNLEILDFTEFKKLELIGEAAFEKCDKITAVHFSPATVTLGKYAFDSCSSLKDITLSTGLSAIPSNAFSNASNLEIMYIPANVTGIGDEAFFNDGKLTEIHIPKTTTTFGKDIFSKGNALIIYVVEGSPAHEKFKNDFTCRLETVYVKSIVFSDKQVEVDKGKKIKPYITIDPSHYSVDITYESSDSKIFTVSDLGEITGVAPGNATLTASAPAESGGKVSAMLKVHVRQPVTGVKINPASVKISTGESTKLTPVITPGDAENKNVTWKSENEEIASVSNDGTVYGKKAGTVKITVTTEDQNKTATCTVIVEEQQSSSSDFRNEDAKAPVADVSAGSVDAGTVVKLSTETIGANIYYTINGNDPIATSEGVTTGNTMLYAGPIVINSDTTIKAIAVCTGYHNSKVVSFEYKVGDGWGDIDTENRYLFGYDPTKVPDDLWYVFDGDPNIYTKSATTNVEREYTGEKITFDSSIHVFNGKTKLTEKRDYTLSYSNNKALTTASKKAIVKIKGKGNYTGTAQFEFAITKVSLRNAKIVSGTNVTISVGEALSTVVPEVVCKGKKLASADYTVEYYRNEVKDANKVDKSVKAEAGNYFAVVKASAGSDYKDSPEENVLIRAVTGTTTIPMSKVQVSDLTVDYKTAFKLTDLFDGTTTKTPVKFESTELIYGVDYTVEAVDTEAYPDYPSIGTYVFKLKGTNTGKNPSYDGEKAVKLTIKGTAGNKPVIKCLNTSPIYTGSEITLNDLYKKDNSSYTGVTLVDGSYTLVEGQDYTVDLSQSKEFGKFIVYFNLKGKYSGTLKKKITIKQYKLNDTDGKVKFTVSGADYCKTGAIPADINVTYNGKRLREGIDYKVKVSNNKSTSSKKQPTVKITGKGCFKGSLSRTFTISKRKLSDLKLFVSDQKYAKNNKASSYKLLPKVEDDGKYLTAKDIEGFTIKDCSYINCNDGNPIADSASLEQGTRIEVRVNVTAKAGSMYEGTNVELIGHYSVVDPSKLFGGNTSVDFTNKAVYFEDGEYVMPVKGTDYNVTHAGKKLNSSDYDIVYISKNRFLGSAKVKVAGKREYGGIKTKTVRVKAKKLQ